MRNPKFNNMKNTYSYKLKEILFNFTELKSIDEIDLKSNLSDLNINEYDKPCIKAMIKETFGVDLQLNNIDLSMITVKDLLKTIRILVHEKSPEQKEKERKERETIKRLSVKLSAILNHQRVK